MLTNPPTSSTSVSTLVEVDQGKTPEGEVRPQEGEVVVQEKKANPKKSPNKKPKKEIPVENSVSAVPPDSGNVAKKNRRKQTIQERPTEIASPPKAPPAVPKVRKQTKPRAPRKSKANQLALVPTSTVPSTASTVNNLQRISNSNLNFTIFPDTTRDIGAIGPSQLILAVEEIREPGTWEELLKDQAIDQKALKEFQCKLLSVYLSVPHFLPLRSVYSSGEPFARILRFSQLEDFTGGYQGNYQLSSYRFYGPRYESQVPTVSHLDEKKPAVKALRTRLPNPDGYLESCIFIKHPILSFYSRKNISLQFVVLKKIRVDSSNLTVVGHLKSKVVQLKRSEDLKNIEIYVDEQRLSEPASDVSEMNHQNIQPVINSSTSGIVPVVQQQAYPTQRFQAQLQYPQQSYQQTVQHHPETKFHYYSFQEVAQNPAAQVYSTQSVPSVQPPNVVHIEGQQFLRSEVEQQPQEFVVLADNNIYKQPQQYSTQQGVHHNTTPSQYSVVERPQDIEFQSPTKVNTQYICIPGLQPIQLEFIQSEPQGSGLEAQSNVHLLPSTSIGQEQQIILQPGPPKHFQLQQQQHQQQLHQVRHFEPQYSIQNQASPHRGQSVIVQQQPASIHQQQSGSHLQQTTQFRVSQSTQSLQLVQSSASPAQSVQQNTYNQRQGPQQNQLFQSQPSPTQQSPPFQVTYRTPVNFSPVAAENSQQQSVQPTPPQTKPSPKKPKKQKSALFAQTTANVPQQYPASLQQSHPKAVQVTYTTLPPNSLHPTSLHPLTQSGGQPIPASPTSSKVPSTAGRSPVKSYSRAKSTQEPKLPKIDSTHSLSALASVSSGTNLGAQVAGKLVLHSTSTAPGPSSPAVTQTAPGGQTHRLESGKTLKVISTSPAPVPTPPAVRERKLIPGKLAVCPHCGVCSENFLWCKRCHKDLPSDVKSIEDRWEVNSKGAAVAIQSSASTPKSAAPSKQPQLDKKVSVPTAKKQTKAPAKKIVLVNKPQPPTIVNVATNPGGSTSVAVAPGSVLVQPQPGGGCAVTINSGGAVVSSTVGPQKIGQTKIVPPKRRAPVRKRQAHECITLSSDDEDTSPSKQAKPDEKPQETTASSLVASAKQEAVLGAVSGSGQPAEEVAAAVPTAEQTGAGEMGKKGLKINLSESPVPETKEPESLDVKQVSDQIEEKMNEEVGRFQYSTLSCRSIRVGSYKVTAQDIGLNMIRVRITELGFKFTLPSTQFKTKNVEVCIPKNCISEIKAHFTKRLAVLFITTGPKYAVWVRQALGMEGDRKMEGGDYFCPLNGSNAQKKIVLLADSFDEPDIGIITKLYNDVIHEMTYIDANELLMKCTPQSFKSSIGMGSPSSSSESSPAPPTKTVNNGFASPSESNVSQATTVIVTTSEATSTTVSSPLTEQDMSKVILSYETVNKGRVDVSPNDIKCLGGSQFLNDQIIELWLAVILKEKLSEEDRKRTFVYDSFFYSKLTEKTKRRANDEAGKMTAGERRHSRVKKRTKNVDIFSKDFLVIPINENYHWFIAIICFPWMEGYCDYNSLEPIPDYVSKKPRLSTSASAAKKKPIVFNQPQHGSTASYSNRDEAPEESDEIDQISSPDTPMTMPDAGNEGKSQVKTESSVPPAGGSSTPVGAKQKTVEVRPVKCPCILVFDSLSGESRARIYSTLREYLKLEYKAKKNADRIFNKDTMTAFMPKVPQQPNFSDCGLFMLEYVEAFFRSPIPTYDQNNINLKNWFDKDNFGVNKRLEIFNFIKTRIQEKSPQFLDYIPQVSFDPDENEEDYQYSHIGHEDDMDDEDYEDDELDSSMDDELFQTITKRKKSLSTPAILKKPKLDGASEGEGPTNVVSANTPKPTQSSPATAVVPSLSTAMVTITPIPASSDTTSKKNNG